jgi:hypothetical protein
MPETPRELLYKSNFKHIEDFLDHRICKNVFNQDDRINRAVDIAFILDSYKHIRTFKFSSQDFVNHNHLQATLNDGDVQLKALTQNLFDYSSKDNKENTARIYFARCRESDALKFEPCPVDMYHAIVKTKNGDSDFQTAMVKTLLHITET